MTTDLKRTFDDLDRLDMPLKWSDVKERRTGPASREPQRSRRVLVAGMALAIAGAGIAVAIRAIVFSNQRPGTESANGKIAFVRGGPDGGIYTMEPDGSGLQRNQLRPKRLVARLVS